MKWKNILQIKYWSQTPIASCPGGRRSFPPNTNDGVADKNGRFYCGEVRWKTLKCGFRSLLRKVHTNSINFVWTKDSSKHSQRLWSNHICCLSSLTTSTTGEWFFILLPTLSTPPNFSTVLLMLVSETRTWSTQWSFSRGKQSKNKNNKSMQTSTWESDFVFSVNNINQPLEEEWSTFWVPLGIFQYIQPALEMRRVWHHTGNKSAF